MMLSLTAMAEERVDTVVITLRDGSEVRYTTDQFDRVQVIENLKYGVKVYLKGGKSKDYLASKVEVRYYQSGGEVVIEDNNKNRNKYRAKLLEYPHLHADSTRNQLLIKTTDNYGITFSVEWSYNDLANRWTCYQLYAGNMQSNVDRTNAFADDTEIPAAYRSHESDYKGSGYSKGHLCPSADRLCSEEQNRQTFLMSNMQPQWQNHNGMLWERLEGKVRTWASDCDTLYVVKAATIRSDQVYSNKVNNRLPVPKYFYMALLAYNKKNNSYQAMGLWTEHNNDKNTNKNYGDYAISIDKLEELTGIDFFCNLPDDIEDDVESDAKLNLNYWGIKKTSE